MMGKRFLFRHIKKDGNDFLEIADDLVAIHQAYAEMLLKRYAENPRANFVTGGDSKEMRQWIIGQRMFQSFLNQYRIPCIHDDPAFKFPEERIVPDFIIDGFGEIDVKTRPWNTDTMIIKKATWDVYVKNNTIPDYVLALMLHPEEKMAQIMGYEHGKEVSELPNAPHICIHTPCYSKLYDQLHSFRELSTKLQRCSLKKASKTQSTQETLRFRKTK